MTTGGHLNKKTFFFFFLGFGDGYDIKVYLSRLLLARPVVGGFQASKQIHKINKVIKKR